MALSPSATNVGSNPSPRKDDPQHLGEGGVIIDDQHATFHIPHRSMSAVVGG